VNARLPLVFLCALLGLALGTGVAWAQPTFGVQRDRSAWQAELRGALAALETARARQATAEQAYSDARHRRRARGATKAAILAERERAAEAVVQAERNLENLYERARAAGVPPGWLRLRDEPGAAAPESP
jgi:ribonuclease HI